MAGFQSLQSSVRATRQALCLACIYAFFMEDFCPAFGRRCARQICSEGLMSFWLPPVLFVYLQRRYVPVVGDNVVGTVTGKPGESFTVDIGTARSAK